MQTVLQSDYYQIAEIGGSMTLQQLKYMIVVAERGSITEAAKELYISQPSLSGAIKEVEKEAGITIFSRCRAGVALTKEGMEFLGYARQVVQQMELLESKYVDKNLQNKDFVFPRSIIPLRQMRLWNWFSILDRNGLNLS